jgi:single-strand DNA-binding protein
MSQDNHITLRGYLCAEPILHQKTSAATPVTEIRVGSTPRRLNRETGEWHDAPASYYTVKCWRRLAINAASSLHKGDMVVVRGRFYMNQWVDSQQRHQSRLEIEADSLGHDLAYGWSHYLRGTRSQSERAEGVNAGEMARQDIGPADESDPEERGFAGPPPTGPSVTESDDDRGLEPDGILGASDPADDTRTPAAEAVPF